MITFDHVSMRYNLGREKIFSLKEYFIKFTRRQLKFEEFWALKDVSFSIEKGEILGIVGVNGSGKSTLLKIIAGVLKPTQGSVATNGNIAPMIELGAGFDYEMTASENIYLNGAIMGLSKDFIKSKYDEIVEFSELKDFMNVPMKNFSTGMVARLAFSISTIVTPDILIIDEILSVGDEPFQRKSEQKMKELIHGGTTVAFVSHSIKQIEEICTKCIWLDHGVVMAFDDVSKVCTQYKDFCASKQ